MKEKSLILAAWGLFALAALQVSAASFNSGSDGSYGALEFGPFLGVKFASDQFSGPCKSYAAAAPTMAG